MSRTEQWGREHVGVTVEVGGTPWCFEDIRPDGRAVLREEVPPGIRPDAARVRTAPVSAVYRSYVRQYAQEGS
jgi:hypothetical protein